MPGDAVITRAGPVTVPLEYEVPTGTEIVPRVLSVSFDGSLAAGDYVPVLEVIAPTGAVTAYCARQVTIAAGASVLVSFFPGVAEADQAADSAAATVSMITSSAGTITVNNPTGPAVNVDLPPTGVVAGGYGDASDAVQVTIDTEGRITAASSVPIAGGGSVVASDGWVPDTTETWTYASFTAGPPAVGTFTVPGDLRAKYTRGTKIKLNNPDTRYFVVIADPTYDGTNTTVSITGGTDYVLSNAAIAGNYHSYVVNPQGWPGAFNFNANPQGWSVLTTNLAQFHTIGRQIFVYLDFAGTSNATTATCTGPVANALAAAQIVAMLAVDNGVIQTTPCRVQIPSGASTITSGRNFSSGNGGWTNSGTKQFEGALLYDF